MCKKNFKKQLHKNCKYERTMISWSVDQNTHRKKKVQSVGTVEYAVCISAEG